MDSQEMIPAASLIEAYSAMKRIQYLVFAGYAAVVSDYLHTLPDELRYMWPSRLSLPKVLFFTLRYYMLAHGLLAINQVLLTGQSPEVCKAGFIRTTVSSLVVVSLSEAIMFLRVYAFSGQNKKLLALLLFLYVASLTQSHFELLSSSSGNKSLHGSATYLIIRFLPTVEYVSLPPPVPERFCILIAANSAFLAGAYATFLVSATVVMIIMVTVAYWKHWGLRSSLFKRFYRDGIFYFVCLSVLAAINMLSLLGLVNAGYLLGQIQIDLHTILSTRMLLHLRAYAHSQDTTVGIAQPPMLDVSTGSANSGSRNIPLRNIQFRHHSESQSHPADSESVDNR